MSLYKKFKTDENKEVNGFRVELTEAVNQDGSIPVFIVGRIHEGNVNYSRAVDRASRPHRRQIQLGVFDNQKAERILRDVFIESVLLGWENVQDEKGNKLPFNKENAIKLFDDLPDLYKLLRSEAAEFENFKVSEREEDAKN